MLVTCQKNHAIKVGIFLLLRDMRKLILVSATSFEIEPTLQFLSGYRLNGQVYQLGNLQIQACITGVGMINTAFELGRCGAQQFDLALNAGLAGCFGNRPKGSVLNIVSDCFSELGAQDDERFLTIDELGFGQQQQVPEKPLSLNFLSQLPSAHGITVNTVHGHEASITALQSRLSPDTESMEGAAFFMAANRFGWTCAQIRAISNKVEKRQRETWEIALAVSQLNQTLIKLLEDLSIS